MWSDVCSFVIVRVGVCDCEYGFGCGFGCGFVCWCGAGMGVGVRHES